MGANTMTDNNRLSELRQQLAEAVARLAELDAASITEMIEAKAERDVTALETRKAQARERIVVLQKAIKQLEHQAQLDAQAYMMRETEAFMGPLVAPLNQATAALLLPPHVPDKPVSLEPEVVKPKQFGKWFGNPKQVGGRWNERLR
jgi:hypothetical protein